MVSFPQSLVQTRSNTLYLEVRWGISYWEVDWIFFLWKAVVNINIPLNSFIFPMTLLTPDDHLTAEAWAAKALVAQALPQNTGSPKELKKNNSVVLFCFKGWYRYVHVSFTYFLEQVQSNFELSWIKDT